MKLLYAAQKPVRARKDERPNLNREGKIWEPKTLIFEGRETYALISGHWLYFEHEGQWYKLNCEKYEVPIEGPISLDIRHEEPMTEEERRAKKKARRQARRLAAKCAELEEDEEDEE